MLAKYGQEYFRELRKRRKQYPKQDPPALPTIPPAVLSGRENGRRGGLARATQHSPEELSRWARRGGLTTRKRYGKTFFREIRKLRTYYASGYLAAKTKQRIKKQTEELMRSLAQN